MNRYYSSQWGRFLSTDPRGSGASLGSPQSWNRYAYTRGDPVNSNDPTGLVTFGGGSWPFDCDMEWGVFLSPFRVDEENPLTADPLQARCAGGHFVGMFLGAGADNGGGGSDPLILAYFSAFDALQDPSCRGIFNTDPNRPNRS